MSMHSANYHLAKKIIFALLLTVIASSGFSAADEKERVWYLSDEKKKVFGPYSAGEVKQWYHAGKLKKNIYAWKKGMSGWMMIDRVPEFKTDGKSKTKGDSSTTSDAILVLPPSLGSISMGMSVEKLKKIRKDVQGFSSKLTESPSDKESVYLFFGLQSTAPDHFDVSYFFEDNRLRTIYINFSYGVNMQKRDTALVKMAATVEEMLGAPTSGGTAGMSMSWDFKNLFYSISSGVAGTDNYWMAYQIDKK